MDEDGDIEAFAANSAALVVEQAAAAATPRLGAAAEILRPALEAGAEAADVPLSSVEVRARLHAQK
jgi:hypothetical protein